MLAHRLLGGGSSSLSVSRPSLGSALITAARARLWSSFRQCSESPLLEHPETMVSCLLGRSRLFPGLPPGQLWCANPFRLCSRRQPQSSPCDLTEARASAPSPACPGGGADKPLGLVSAARHRSSVREPLRFALHTPVAALSSVAPKPPLCHPQSPPAKVLPNVWKPFLLHSSLPLVRVPSVFVSVFPFFFCPTRVCGEFLAF